MADIKNFALNSNEKLEEQIAEFASSEAYKESKIRIMPDGHPGKGAVVGSTMTYTDKICPNTVGVDIACRVSLWKMPYTADELDQRWFGAFDNIIKNNIPAGFNIRKDVDLESYTKIPMRQLECFDNLSNLDRINRSLGTLGGGNHMIELDIDSKGQLYLLIHTGSRNLGKQVCEYYQKLAEDNFSSSKKEYQVMHDAIIEQFKAAGRETEINEALKEFKQMHIIPNSSKDLAYISGELMESYLNDVKICRTWSYYNHQSIAWTIFDALGVSYMKIKDPYINCIHNYVDIDNKIIRKGAISAQEGELGLIPLNMRDGVLIVRGLGNEDWNCSLPHGAGRILSRGEARGQLTLEDYKDSMKDIYTSCVREDTLDEAPMVYKDSKLITSAIGENAEVLEQLFPVYNFKAGN